MRVQQRNPHFDDGRIVWRDAYSGQYAPPAAGYSEQFDLQWKLALQGEAHYYDNSGASAEDEFIEQRVYEWTGLRPPNASGAWRRPTSVRVLDHPVDPARLRGKDCVDVGCGMGRWTRTMLALGARSVLSIDMSASGLKNVSRFNSNTLVADVMQLATEHPELSGTFDFATFWGVAHHKHDPSRAFTNAAQLVRPGGALYLMVYAPEEMHGLDVVTRRRKHFHRLGSVEERLRYVDRIYDRRWDSAVSPYWNVRDKLKNVLRRPRGTKVGILDMLEPFFNWVIPEGVARGWFAREGFTSVQLVNDHEPKKCAFHFVGIKGTSMP